LDSTEQHPGKLARLGHALALQKTTVSLLVLVVFVGMGERLAERFLPVYLIALGGGPLVVALFQAMDNGLSALYSLPGGYLADRVGEKKSLLIFNLIAASGFAAVIAFPFWQVVIIGAVCFISWSAISLPATMSLIYKVLPAGKRTMGVSMHSLVRRIPMALGPLAGGALIELYGIEKGMRLAFTVALGLAVIAIFMQQRLLPGHSEQRREEKGQEKNERNDATSAPPYSLRYLRSLYGKMPADLRRLLVTDILIRFCEQIPYAFVVVWCLQEIAHPVSPIDFGILTTIEMATAVLIYIPVAFFADKGEKKPFVLTTFIFFTLFPLVLLASHSFWVLVPAFVLRGLKEFGEPTRKSLILDLSPPDCRAAMFGLYYLIRDLIVAVAALTGGFLWQVSPRANLLTAFAFGVAGTVAFAAKGRSISPH